MAKSVRLNEHVKPANLPTNCRSQLGGENVIAAGMGWTEVDNASTYHHRFLRYAEFATMPTANCVDRLQISTNRLTIVCANTANNKAIYSGDSGEIMKDDLRQALDFK